MSLSDNLGIIGVHVGAGHHSVNKTEDYKKICKKACRSALENLHRGLSVVECVVNAVVCLEDCSITNAGYGSNLTIKGCVENDASVMNGSTRRSGSVGAVSSIRNPVELAKLLLYQQEKGLLPCGRIPPSFLAGEGARAWALENKIPVIPNDELITDEARILYKKYSNKVKRYEVSPKKPRLENVCNNFEVKPPEHHLLTDVSDTVGAICIDIKGNCAAAVSSGGLLLKHPGRIGPAAMFGCGCWAQNSKGTDNSVAVSTSGCGESLIRTFFAKECAAAVQNADCSTVALHDHFTKTLISSEFLLNSSERLAGSLVAVYEPLQKRGEILWAHTTDSMCIGFVSSLHKNVTVRMSRQNAGTSQGSSVVVEALPYSFK